MKGWPQPGAIARFLLGVAVALLAYPLPVAGLLVAYFLNKALDLKEAVFRSHRCRPGDSSRME